MKESDISIFYGQELIIFNSPTYALALDAEKSNNSQPFSCVCTFIPGLSLIKINNSGIAFVNLKSININKNKIYTSSSFKVIPQKNYSSKKFEILICNILTEMENNLAEMKDNKVE